MISSGMSIFPGQTPTQLPHWMQSPWISFERSIAPVHAVRIVPMPPV